MKQVFLIQAHKDPGQLAALVEQLRDDDFLVYVNLDRKSAIDPAAIPPHARLVRRRIDVHWGGFSQVQAVLNALEQILAEVPDFDKLVFLSAQDFPLLSNARLKRELETLRGRELLDVVALGRGPGQWPAAFRYQYFYKTHSPRPLRLAYALVNRLMRATGRVRRMPGALQPWGGSSWWALSRDCVAALLARVRREPRLLRFFGRVANPDEMFFQTLVMNSHFAPRVLGRNFRYIQWPERGTRHPKILVEDDFERIAASQAHFCRKIDSQASAELVKRLLTLRNNISN